MDTGWAQHALGYWRLSLVPFSWLRKRGLKTTLDGFVASRLTLPPGIQPLPIVPLTDTQTEAVTKQISDRRAALQSIHKFLSQQVQVFRHRQSNFEPQKTNIIYASRATDLQTQLALQAFTMTLESKAEGEVRAGLALPSKLEENTQKLLDRLNTEMN